MLDQAGPDRSGNRGDDVLTMRAELTRGGVAPAKGEIRLVAERADGPSVDPGQVG